MAKNTDFRVRDLIWNPDLICIIDHLFDFRENQNCVDHGDSQLACRTVTEWEKPRRPDPASLWQGQMVSGWKLFFWALERDPGDWMEQGELSLISCVEG